MDTNGATSSRTETLAALKRQLRCAPSFHEVATESSTSLLALWKPGTIGEFLWDRPGSGAATVAWESLLRWLPRFGACAVIDPRGDSYSPAIAAWGTMVSRVMVIRPCDAKSAWWAVEQCLRSRAIAATCAWVERASERVLRRWQLAAEAGGGVGMFFRPVEARREPSWAEFRVLVTPQPSVQGETRRVRLETLYRRGGLGGSAQVWEIDHAEGCVQLVPTVAHPKTLRSATGA